MLQGQLVDKLQGVLLSKLTSTSNCCLDKGIQLLITTDGKLQVTGSDTLHLQVFGGISRQLQNLLKYETKLSQGHSCKQRNMLSQICKVGRAYFSSEVLKDGSTVHSCCGANATMAGCAGLQVSVDTTHWELSGSRHKTVVSINQCSTISLIKEGCI